MTMRREGQVSETKRKVTKEEMVQFIDDGCHDVKCMNWSPNTGCAPAFPVRCAQIRDAILWLIKESGRR